MLALQGDPDAQRIFNRFGEVLGILLAGLINVLNVEMFVIGGGVISGWDAFAPTMFAELCDRSLVYAATVPDDVRSTNKAPSPQIANYTSNKTIITKAILGSDAGLYGAARTPLSQ